MADLIERDAVLSEIIAFRKDNAERSGDNDMMRGKDIGCEFAMDVIARANTVNRWISVEDALPEIGYSVLVTRQTESNTRYIRIASRQDDCWMDNIDKYGKPNPHQVVAWMPMPDAYEPPEKE